MAEFAYHNTKNVSIGHTFFKLNCGYQPRVSFEENINPCLKFCSANELTKELKELMEVYCQNLLYTQKL